MAVTKGSERFPKPSTAVVEVTQSELDQSVEDAKAMIKVVEEAIAHLKAKAPDVTKAVFDAAVSDLETSIAALPTSTQLDAVKTDVTAVQDKFKALDTDKADKTSVEAANTAIKAVDTALKALAALPVDVTQQELDAAIADYTKKLKAADDAIAAANQSILSITPPGAGKTLDLNSIKTTGSGFYNGAALAGGPSNAGSGGSGCWAYSGDAVDGTMMLVVWSAPDLRLAEGSWMRSRSASAWGEWGPAPKATDFQVTTGDTTAITGQNWAIAPGHVVSLTYADSNKTIKLKPANGDWKTVPQFVAGGFTVPNKPLAGSETIELKIDTAKGEWILVPQSVDIVNTRLMALESKDLALDSRIKALEGVDYDLQNFALDGGRLFTAAEALGLYDLVHIRTLDGKLELASDAVQDRPADGIVIAPVAINGTTKVFGSGSKLSDLGMTGLSQNTRLYMGKDGEISLSPSGSNRFIKEIGMYRNSAYYLSFSDVGYWIS